MKKPDSLREKGGDEGMLAWQSEEDLGLRAEQVSSRLAAEDKKRTPNFHRGASRPSSKVALSIDGATLFDIRDVKMSRWIAAQQKI